ncbi:MAG: tRNA nucleotidyltransferase, partial [Firmicutes bacterium]|nr:tRNA nucleotidyltransferase [Bacillota bacterium]
MEHSLAAEIASRVSERGGRAYYVGGFVRDAVLGIENKDIDIEVHGIEPADLFSLLSELGEPLSYGSSFGIYSVKGSGIDVALPRTERATGRGHRDFEVFCDPYLGPEKAARRRDFTMNALMKDVLSGEILDFFGGMEDIRRGIIRHVDDRSFAEDPLRVLRAAQFAARFGFKVAPETVRLCSRMDLTALSRERVEGEMRKALEKAEKPSVFFEFLRETGQLGFWFPELEALIGVEQDPRFHPEGDVWVHSMEVL